MSLDSFKEILSPIFDIRRGGGRRPQEPNQPALDQEGETKSYLTPCKEGEARLTIVQITDVYTLDNFASLKTLLKEIRAAQGEDDSRNKVISMLTGDFLAPYLLSSVDRGAGMMNALSKTPIDYLTWGNHEADIDHRTVCRHVKKWKGKWINTNMQSHEAMEYQQPYDVVEIESPDGSNKRKVGLAAVLSDDPKLYSGFKAPGAFGGATIDVPWETLLEYKTIMEQEEGCDLVVPLEHLYVHENEKTCQDFDFPVILSGHDHHRVDQIINGTRLIKPGMDGVFCTVLEIVWETKECSKPTIRSTFVETATYKPCPELKAETDAAYDVLLPLRNTELAMVLPQYRPLTSKNARGSLCTMGRLVCSMLKESLEQTRKVGETKVDAVILMGGNIRGNEDYPEDSFFSLETLEAEVKPDEVIGVVPIPGSVLAAGIESTHAGDPRPGWFQFDDGIREEEIDGKKRIVTVAYMPLDPDRIYHCATKIKDLTNGQSPPLKEYFIERMDLLPSKGDYVNIHSELMGFFARNLFRKLWDALGIMIPDPEEILEEASHPAPSVEEVEGQLRLDVLDRSGDGTVTVGDIHVGLRDFLGLSVNEEVKTLAEMIHSYADITGSGKVTVDDFEQFCTGMPKEFRTSKKWSMAFPDPLPELSREPSFASDSSMHPSLAFTEVSDESESGSEESM